MFRNLTDEKLQPVSINLFYTHIAHDCSLMSFHCKSGKYVHLKSECKLNTFKHVYLQIFVSSSSDLLPNCSAAYLENMNYDVKVLIYLRILFGGYIICCKFYILRAIPKHVLTGSIDLDLGCAYYRYPHPLTGVHPLCVH